MSSITVLTNVLLRKWGETMFVDFDKVFTEPDWANIKLTGNSPCVTCEHRINLREIHPGNTADYPIECTNCYKRLSYIITCLEKLAWYERKEKEGVVDEEHK